MNAVVKFASTAKIREYEIYSVTRIAIGERVIVKRLWVFAIPSSNLSSYYAITTWGPLMGPMLCTKESRYARMQLRSAVCTRLSALCVERTACRVEHRGAQRNAWLCHAPQFDSRLRLLQRAHSQPPVQRSAGNKRLHEIQYFRTCHSSKPLHLQQSMIRLRSYQIHQTFPSRRYYIHVRVDATRWRSFLFLLCNRNARCSSTSGSNLLPVRLHRAIDNGAATTTSHYVHVRSCFLSIGHAFVSTDFFPDTFLSLTMIKEHVLSRATHLHFFSLCVAPVKETNLRTY